MISDYWIQMTLFFGQPGWFYWWVSSCSEPAATDTMVWPPADVASAVPVLAWLIPLLFLGSVSAAIGFALISWAGRRPRKVIYSALGAGAMMIGIFIAQLYLVASNTPFSFGALAMSLEYFVFAGNSIRSAAICGVTLGASALMLRVLHSRLWQGVILCLALLQSVLLTAAWGAFAYASTCWL